MVAMLAGLLAQAVPDSSIPPIVGAAFGIPFLIWLWWNERKDRIKAEERERLLMEKVYGVVDILGRALEVVKKG